MLDNNERQKQTVKRTICIGLGGTGKDVLMRIRRLIVDRYGDLTELPLISFVHIDTDKGARQVSGLRSGSIYHGVDLSFRDAETVSATMNRTEINTFVQGIEQRGIHEQQGPYDNIERWFPRQLLKDIRGIEDGAKGIRPVGRLAFFHNYRQIKETIDKAEIRTRDHENNLLRKGWIVEPGLNIFVIASLCGGTGSGMFLDMAYHLRRFYGDLGAQIFAYLVISPELYGQTPSMYSNTYAALKELNYYTTLGVAFEACYDIQNLIYVKEQRPPFEYVYLVSNQTEGDYKIVNKNKLANVIAYKIFLDFSGEIASQLRSQKDNFLQHMLHLDQHPRPNVQRYLTFGLASIYLPRDISIQIALNRICLKLLNFWSEGEGQNPDAQDLLSRFLLKWQGEQINDDYFSFKLKEVSQDSGRTFVDTINSWKKRLENNLVNCDSKEDKIAIKEQLFREIREQFRKVIPGQTDSTRGIWLTMLQENQPRVTELLKQDIAKFLEELLQPGNQDFSLQTARAWLEALITYLNKQQRNLEDKIQSQGGMNQLENLDKKLKNQEQNLEDINNQSSFLGFGKKQKNLQFEEISNSTIKEGYNLILHNFELTLKKLALEIVKDLQQYIQNLIRKASELHILLNNIYSFYETQEEEIKNLNDDEMSGQAVFAEGDTDEYYEILLPRNEQRSQLVVVSQNISEKVVLGESLSNFLSGDRLVEEAELKNEIYATVDRLFGTRSNEIIQSVIKRFMRSYPSSSERSIRLEQIMYQAENLLPLNFADPYFYNDPGKTLKLIAFKDSDESEVTQLKNILTNDLGIPDSVLKPIQAEDEILIINEYGGFPLRIINNLEQMRQHYERQKNQELAFLHNEYSTIFTDIIPPPARKIQEIQDIYYPCLAFKVLKYNSQNRTYQFEYFDYLRGTTETVSLSSVWLEAVEQLSQQQNMVETLNEFLTNIINEIKNQSNPMEVWRKNYLENYFYPFVRNVEDLPENHPNYYYREQVIGKRESLESPAKEGIIQRFCKRIEKELTQSYTLTDGMTPSNRIAPSQFPIDAECVDTEQPDFLDKLDKLIARKEQGYITEQEFQNAKKQLGL